MFDIPKLLSKRAAFQRADFFSILFRPNDVVQTDTGELSGSGRDPRGIMVFGASGLRGFGASGLRGFGASGLPVVGQPLAGSNAVRVRGPVIDNECGAEEIELPVTKADY